MRGAFVDGCAPVDLVILMDSSGSMYDEADALCQAIDGLETRLRSRGATLAGVSVLGMLEPSYLDRQFLFPCLRGSVAEDYGSSVPGRPATAATEIRTNEDWGPAVAVVASQHPWAAGAHRIIVPISDEGALGGKPCEDPGLDRESVTFASMIAQEHGVIVSPIAGTGSDACVLGLQRDLALSTGGRSFRSRSPQQEMAGFILSLIADACESVTVPCKGSEQIAVFDDSDILDDQFDVFVDGQFVFRTPVGGGAVSDTCLAGFGSGLHTLEVVFVRDIDDPEGVDPSSNGTYGIALRNGVTFVSGPGIVNTTEASESLFPPGTSHEYEIRVP